MDTSNSKEVAAATTGHQEWWSWRRVLEEVPRLGIPHFQRGQVWETGNRVALLESLYEASPCGSFVLWQPDGVNEWDRIGIPLLQHNGVGEQTKWLVDGQQRTRALLGVFGEMLAAELNESSPRLLGDDVVREIQAWLPNPISSNGAEDGEDEEKKDSPEDPRISRMGTWYVALPKLASLQSIFRNWGTDRRILHGSIFRFSHPSERKEKARRVPLPRGLVPLAVMLAEERGPFAVRETREDIIRLLSARGRDTAALDRLIPWGPQFLTGFAFEDRAGESKQITWSSIGQVEAEVLIALLKFIEEYSHPFREMMTGPRFAVGWLPRKGLGAAITAYVRINRAGIRVRPEEHALALLTRWDENILDRLGEFCRRRDRTGCEVTDDRAHLVHESERQMGFPIWISTVTRFTALFLMARSARHWMGVGAMEKQTFLSELEQWPRRERDVADQKALIERAARSATETLLLVDEILSNELCLDHRMARRDTRSIQPFLELLSHLQPDDIARIRLDHTMRRALAFAMHVTMLHPYIDNPGLNDICDEIHGPGSHETDGRWVIWRITREGGELDPESDVGQALRRYMKALYELWGQTQSPEPITRGETLIIALRERALKYFDSEVDKATSTQHQSVGWLYAIERRLGAGELNWQVQFAANRADKNTGVASIRSCDFRAEPLGAFPDRPDLRPEKQHIVPFTWARKITGKGGTRTTASKANAVGNLTWISSRQNGFEHGFSDRWSVFDEQADGHNLNARGMLVEADGDGSGGQIRAVDLYLEMQKQVRESATPPTEARSALGRQLYETFCKTRASWVKKQMRLWLEEPLSDASLRWLV